MIKLSYALIFLILLSCQQKNQNNVLLIINNAVQDSSATQLELQINGEQIFNNSINRFNTPDKFYFLELYLDPSKEHNIQATMPRYRTNEKFKFNFDFAAVVEINLHYEPILDNELTQQINKESLSPPSIRIRKYKNQRLKDYYSLEHVLLTTKF